MGALRLRLGLGGEGEESSMRTGAGGFWLAVGAAIFRAQVGVAASWEDVGVDADGAETWVDAGREDVGVGAGGELKAPGQPQLRPSGI